MTSREAHDPRDSSYGPDYWLHRCEGFRVDLPDREVGTVKGLRFRDSIEPELLEVRTGLFGRRLLLIPVERVQPRACVELDCVSELQHPWARAAGSTTANRE
jgi:hypothetical protein